MDRRLELITALMPHIENYCESNGPMDVKGFADFIKAVSGSGYEDRGSKKRPDSAIPLMDSYGDQGASLSFHLNRLGKYAKYYIKEAFKQSEFLNADDFGFLAAVVEKGEMSKSALIAYNVHEVPSGMEVIRRLHKKGMLTERVDPNDRRVKMISVTKRGEAEFFKAIQLMQPIARIIGGKLTKQELIQLNALLSKLDRFHEYIYQSENDYNLERILDEHL